jgi:hypothetical protein
MIAFRRSSGESALPFELETPFILGEWTMPSTALIFLKRALPITKPDALLFEDDFLGAMVSHSGVYSLTRRCPILRAKRKYSARSEYHRF